MANRGTTPASKLGIQQQAKAQDLALAAFDFLSAEPRRLSHFLAMSGIGLESIRAACQDPGFLAGVIAHISEDESLLLAFCAHSAIDPNDVAGARAALGGLSWEADTP